MRNKKGYYAALFSFLCVVAVFAGVNLTRQNEKEEKAKEQMKKAQIEAQEYERVDANKNAPSAQLPQVQVEAEAELPKQAVTEFDKDYVEGSSGTDVAKVEPEPVIEPEEEKLDEVAFDEGVDSEEAVALDNKVKLQWPVAGDIVMDYSTDVAIYDQTLDQYRTNDSVAISAENGTAVKAAGDGVVEFVGMDTKDGEKIVINHNNGWKTTYSQLDANVLVKNGDTVRAGQAIGSVGVPSKYSVALGSHLEFQVTRDDQSLDPKVALAE